MSIGNARFSTTDQDLAWQIEPLTKAGCERLFTDTASGAKTDRPGLTEASGRPVLLRVDYDAGHGVGSTRGQQDAEAVDTYAFLLWRTGVGGYQPV